MAIEPTSKYRITESPFPHRKTRFVSGSYKGNITPLDVSNSTITIGSSKASGARKEYCRSDDLLNLNENKIKTSRTVDRLKTIPELPSGEY